MLPSVAVAHPDEILRSVADRMAAPADRGTPGGRPGRPRAPRRARSPSSTSCRRARSSSKKSAMPSASSRCDGPPSTAILDDDDRGRSGRQPIAVERAIVGFERDEAGDWVALLDCGHRQHVRHRRPGMSVPGSSPSRGGRGGSGSPLECRACDEEGAGPRCGAVIRPAVANRVCPDCGALDGHSAPDLLPRHLAGSSWSTPTRQPAPSRPIGCDHVLLRSWFLALRGRLLRVLPRCGRSRRGVADRASRGPSGRRASPPQRNPPISTASHRARSHSPGSLPVG